jgi:hypothetical protein
MRRPLAVAALALGLAASGCAPAPLRLPRGPGRPVADTDSIVSAALGHCGGLHSISAEAGLSGRAGGRRLRGRLILGVEIPDRLRLEAVAPFGPPIFILAAQAGRSVLLLPRDGRVLRDTSPREVLEALAGVSLSPGDLGSLSAGCVPGGDVPPSARAIGDEWIVFGEPASATKVYLRRRNAGWRLAAVERADMIAAFEHSSTVQPSTVRLQGSAGDGGPRFDISLGLSQVEVNAAIPQEAYTVNVPADAVPISLDELRQAGPMRDRDGSSSSAGRRP